MTQARYQNNSKPVLKKAPVKQRRANKTLQDNRNNNTGLPDELKAGMESLSGVNLDDVKVHYNSSKPQAVQAHAFAQGKDIHLASGQESHLPHELGHVVQQAQGRVKPTTTVAGQAVNDNAALEYEATAMGKAAMQRMKMTGQKDTLDEFIAKRDGSAQFKPMEGMGVPGIDYTVMSLKRFAGWQKTIQAQSKAYGTAQQGDQMVVTQCRDQKQVMQQLSFKLSNPAKAALLMVEGGLSIAAGIALVTLTGGVGIIPGIAAIAVGVSKIVRGCIMPHSDDKKPTAGQNKVLDSLRAFESAAAIVGASMGSGVGLVAGLVFGVAKALRSLFTALSNYLNQEKHPAAIKWLKRFAAAAHVIEATALLVVSGASFTAGDAAKTIGGVATGGTAISKAFRSGDQVERQIDAEKLPEQRPLLRR